MMVDSFSVCVSVPGRKAGGCPQTPVANNNTATESAAAAEGDHKHNISPDINHHRNVKPQFKIIWCKDKIRIKWKNDNFSVSSSLFCSSIELRMLGNVTYQ